MFKINSRVKIEYKSHWNISQKINNFNFISKKKMKEFVKFIDALYEWTKKKVNQAQHRILNYA
jgi:predicted ATPase